MSDVSMPVNNGPKIVVTSIELLVDDVGPVGYAINYTHDGTPMVQEKSSQEMEEQFFGLFKMISRFPPMTAEDRDQMIWLLRLEWEAIKEFNKEAGKYGKRVSRLDEMAMDRRLLEIERTYRERTGAQRREAYDQAVNAKNKLILPS
jgi:hypothetical protein